MNDSIQNLNQLLGGFVEQSGQILNGSLTGIYLHGSLAMGCFNPKKSDVDLLIVTERPLSDDVKRAFLDMVTEYNALGPAKGIELSVVLRDVCRPFVYPTPFDLHFSAGHLARYRADPDEYIRTMKGTDRDLAAHFMILNKRGVCLFGPPIREVFGEVPPHDYMDSIRYDVEAAPEEITAFPMYLTLNLARVLAYREEGLVLSKQEGGAWALSRVPAEYHPLIRDALREYTESVEVDYPPLLALRWAKYALDRIGPIQ